MSLRLDGSQQCDVVASTAKAIWGGSNRNMMHKIQEVTELLHLAPVWSFVYSSGLHILGKM